MKKVISTGFGDVNHSIGSCNVMQDGTACFAIPSVVISKLFIPSSSIIKIIKILS